MRGTLILNHGEFEFTSFRKAVSILEEFLTDDGVIVELQLRGNHQ